MTQTAEGNNIMKTYLFLDTNYINKLVDDNVILKKNDKFCFVISIHILYELMRTFQFEKSHSRAFALFNKIKQLDPIILSYTHLMIESELQKFMQHKKVNFCHLKVSGEIKRQLNEFLRDISNKTLKRISESLKFIESREIAVKAFSATWEGEFLPKKTHFDDYLNYVVACKKEAIIKQANFCIPAVLQENIFNYLTELPAFSSWLLGGLYLDHLGKKYQVIGGDKPDDIRNIIDASYCHYFITDDKWIVDNMTFINKKIKTLNSEQLPTLIKA